MNTKKLLILALLLISGAAIRAGIELETQLPEEIKNKLVQLQSQLKNQAILKTKTKGGSKYPVLLDKNNLRLGLQFITKENLENLTPKQIGHLKDAVKNIYDKGLQQPVNINLTNAQFKLVPFAEGTFNGWRLLLELDAEQQSQAFNDFQKILYDELAQKNIQVDTGASLFITLGFTRFEQVKNAIKDFKLQATVQPFALGSLILTTVNLDVKPTTIRIERKPIEEFGKNVYVPAPGDTQFGKKGRTGKTGRLGRRGQHKL
ncbi:MAG: hypothetical protein AB7R69_06435 [Candidatus Babeliales bacterium]